LNADPSGELPAAYITEEELRDLLARSKTDGHRSRSRPNGCLVGVGPDGEGRRLRAATDAAAVRDDGGTHFGKSLRLMETRSQGGRAVAAQHPPTRDPAQVPDHHLQQDPGRQEAAISRPAGAGRTAHFRSHRAGLPVARWRGAPTGAHAPDATGVDGVSVDSATSRDARRLVRPRRPGAGRLGECSLRCRLSAIGWRLKLPAGQDERTEVRLTLDRATGPRKWQQDHSRATVNADVRRTARRAAMGQRSPSDADPD
jgi:hypothetical protein